MSSDKKNDGSEVADSLVDANTFMPIFDVLERLWSDGYKTKKQDGRWWLFKPSGDGVVSGRSFRELCVNIILAGL